MDFFWIIILAAAVVWFMAAREKRKVEATSEPQPHQWAQTQTTNPETGELVTKFEAPNPATADIAMIRIFVNNELYIPKLERYLEIAIETNAPVEVVNLIKDHIQWLGRFDKK